MNLIWKEIEELQDNVATNPTGGPPSPFYQARSTTVRGGPLPTLTGPAFQQLMSQVVDELRSSGFVLHSDLNKRLNEGLPPELVDQLSGLSRRVTNIESDLDAPDGTLAKIEGRIKTLKDRRAGEAIKRGGKTF